ncbi:tetratricopeptide repeat protein [Streptomyces sp. NPDC052109]|uniref:CHAT domain-containing tetratricopeptide repeat protein n=1 Tax=Streptomyces sp. NPDC052109 TaxID=3155527 RepID=UPI00343757DE
MERLLVDLSADGRVAVSMWPSGEAFPSLAGEPTGLVWPLDGEALEDLRWYLEDYLRAPFGVYEERGPRIAARLPEWGRQVFQAVFGAGAARDAYMRAQDRGEGLEVVLRSGVASLLGLPWELMADPGRPSPLSLDGVAVTRSMPSAELGRVFSVPGSRLRVLMVIARPRGADDVGYQVIARPLLRRLEAVRGEVDLVVLRPPTLERLGEVLQKARAAGEPFQVVHFDGHGVFGEVASQLSAGWGPLTFQGAGARGMLAFEKPGGGADLVPAEQVAHVLARAEVPVVVLNACQSAVLGSQVEAAVATRLLQEGAGAVVAMAYSVYAVAAAEFMTAFYERLFAGDRVAQAVAAGRQRLAQNDRRPSPKGRLPLADWMVPVLYARSEVSFPDLRTERGSPESLEASLDRILEQPVDPDAAAATEVTDLVPVGEFVGRDGLLHTLDAAARLQRVVVLHGPGGVGKTELAKAFGRWWRDSGGVDRPEWVVWHSFEPGVASFGLDGVISSVGQRVFGRRFSLIEDSDERLRVVEQVLQERRLLLVWDNFESVHTMPDPTQATPSLDEDGREALRTFLLRVAGSGRSAVVVTSRNQEAWLDEASAIAVRRIEVAGLEPQDAVEYADQVLAPYPAAQVRRGQWAFGELMQWLDGHPLSMRLVLPHMEHQGTQELLDALAHGTADLLGHDDDRRGASLSASIAYSFYHLRDNDKELLVAVSLFQGIAVTDVLGCFSQEPMVPDLFREITNDAWQRLLEAAAAVGLLTELNGGMFRVHPALPAFLLTRWRRREPEDYANQYRAAQSGMLNAHARLCIWIAHEWQSGNAGLATTIIHLWRRTLSSMLGHALDWAEWEAAQRIANALGIYLDARGLYLEARAWVDRARLVLERPDGTPPALGTLAGGLWLFFVGSEANRQLEAGRLDQAQQTYEEILRSLEQLAPNADQQSRVALAYHQLGMVAEQRGMFEEAEGLHRRSLAIKEELGDRPGRALSYHQLGMVARLRGALAESEEWHWRALAIEEELGYQRGIASTYVELGIVALLEGRMEEAKGRYSRAMSLWMKVGDLPAIATCYHQFGVVAQLENALGDAEEWFQRSLVIREELGDLPGLAKTYHHLGSVVLKRGGLEEAQEWFQRSLAIKEELGDLLGVARSYYQLGMVAQLKGVLREAEGWYRESLAILEDSEDLRALVDIYHQLGEVAQLRGAPREAEGWYQQCLDVELEMGNRSRLSAIYRQLGILAEDRGDARTALGWIVRCVACFEDFPHPATGPGPDHLKRLVTSLGLGVLEETWEAVTGGPLPPAVRAYVLSSPTSSDTP